MKGEARWAGPARWRRAAARGLGAIAVALMVAVAGVALLLPPPARANGPGPVTGGASIEASAAAPGTRAPPGSSPFSGPWVVSGLFASVSSGAARVDPAPACGDRKLRGVVNLNRASERELDLLPGIGPAKAKRIAAWRAAHGPFRRLRDLRRVKGFGRKTVLKLTPYLTLDGPTTAVAPDPR